MKFKFIFLLFFPILASAILVQKSRDRATQSLLLGIVFPEEMLRDNGLLGIAAAKSVLEMEANSEQITISEVEVLIFQTDDKATSDRFIEDFKTNILKSGIELLSSSNNPSYTWITHSNSCYLLYLSSSRKEADIYIGKANQLPVYLQKPQGIAVVQPDNFDKKEPLETAPAQEKELVKVDATNKNAGENISKDLIGNWGNITGAKIYWRDESTNYVTSGVDKGSGLELKPDGTFLQTTLVTSGRPNYRVFVSTTGTWSARENQLIMTPDDRHYRKWENEIIMVDEHSVPEPYIIYWIKKKNVNTGKDCLNVKYDLGQSDWNELCQQ